MPAHFQYTTSIVQALQRIERAREAVRITTIPPLLAEKLQREALLRSTHFSTRIEGNRLTLQEAEAAIANRRALPGRERDVLEVQRYYAALQRVERWAEEGRPVTETQIRRIHGLAYAGRRGRPSPYRDGQNAIRDSAGNLVYLPPEAADVPGLMAELVEWIGVSMNEIAIPIIAGISHYQFETIHPFFDGNGRTGRLLTTWILQANGYSLGRFFTLEEVYVRDLQGYYAALVTHPHHNYYFGRDQADATSWLEYFLRGMADVFSAVAARVQDAAAPIDTQAQDLLRPLDMRARRILTLFATRNEITSAEVAAALGLSQRQARTLISDWVEDGWLIVVNPSRKGRRYGLAAAYNRLLA